MAPCVELQACSCEEELVFREWIAAEGRMISDFLAEKYEVKCPQLGENFPVSDVRVWGPRKFQSAFNSEKMRIQFAFDGSLTASLNRPEKQNHFIEQLKRTVEVNLKEGQRELFRKKLAEKISAKKKLDLRKQRAVELKSLEEETGTESQREEVASTAASSASDELLEGGNSAETSWKDFLRGEMPDISFEVDALLPGPHVLDGFLVRCTLSVGASRILGQQAFPFLFSGSPEIYKTTVRPLPTWLLAVVAGGFFIIFIVLAFFARAVQVHTTDESKYHNEL